MVSQGTGIIFDNPDNTYFAGDTVSGRIQLVLDKPIQLRGIHLQLRGAAEVKWTEKERNSGDGNTEVRTVIYRAEEEYFKTKSYCVGSLLHEPITLPPGTHIYAFSMALPANVPSSFEGKHGSIRYIAKFTIETPWSWCQQTKTEFTVISPHDLTKFPKLLSPAKVQDERYYCCCCCKSVHQTSILMVPKTGYVSGEKIPFIVEVDNAAASSISEVIIKFQQYTRFRSHRPSKSSREDVKVFEMFNLGPVNYKDSKSWNQTMLIPPVPPSSLGSCSIIERQYQLCVSVDSKFPKMIPNAHFVSNNRGRLKNLWGYRRTQPIFVISVSKFAKHAGIYLELRGAAKVKWTETETATSDGNTETNTVTFHAEEEYFKMKYYCVGGPNHDARTLAPGIYVYPFFMALPSTVPSSFEGQYGAIRYIARLGLRRPSKSDQGIETLFSVIAPYDLARFPSLLIPAKAQADKYFCCCCCKSGPLIAVLMVPKSGYVPGEKISFIVEIDNASPTFVFEVTVKFQQHTTFRSHYPRGSSREEVKILEMFKLGSVKSKDSKAWNQSMLIMPLPPSTLGSCFIIEIKYELFLEVSTGLFLDNLTSSIPITIGTIPVITNETATGISGSSTQPGNTMFNVKSTPNKDDGKGTSYGTF
ncbi:hypothetical protein Trydic_g20413 [Trypoxylus dichotomus]